MQSVRWANRMRLIKFSCSLLSKAKSDWSVELGFDGFFKRESWLRKKLIAYCLVCKLPPQISQMVREDSRTADETKSPVSAIERDGNRVYDQLSDFDELIHWLNKLDELKLRKVSIRLKKSKGWRAW